MSPLEYEEYVANVVRQLDFGANAIIQRNTRFEGVRQPGHYEIDVSVKFKVAEKLDFFLIVECKNWSKPVPRPVVQALAQTRDAIAAHKAAIVSPTGFSAEATKVAQVHGIALWVLSEASWSIPLGLDGSSDDHGTAVAERMAFVHLVGINSSNGQSSMALISFSDAQRIATTGTSYKHDCVGGHNVLAADNVAGVDPRTALSQIADEAAHFLGIPVTQPCRS